MRMPSKRPEDGDHPEASGRSSLDKPHVLLIISDDHAWSDYGFMGHATVRTPHLDRLAERSLSFTRGYVPTSLCRPSLASIILGRYPHEHGIVGNDPAMPEGADAATVAARREAVISRFDRFPSLPSLLRDAGYVSLQTGKWWEGPATRGGFDEGMTHGDPQRGGRHGDAGLAIGRKGLETIFDFWDRHQDQPTLVWYAPFLPHQPHDPPQRLLQRYLDAGEPEPLARYHACVEWFDETCGELIDGLEQRRMRENTVIVYVTDNGWIQRTEATAVPDGYRETYAPRSKQSPYEGGIRTPILLSWPEKIAPRWDREHTVSSLDLLPTLLAIAGVPRPEGLPGVNLLETDGEGSTGPLELRETIFGEGFSHDIPDLERVETGLLSRWCISGRWKLILSHDGRLGRYRTVHVGRETLPQLFDLEADPHETVNLASKYPERVADLRARIESWWPVSDPAVFDATDSSETPDERLDSDPPPQARTVPTATSGNRGPRPDIIVIMTDDQGYADLSFHGNPHVRTPNLDRLASNSHRLIDFHVDPTCSETRSALMTGRYSSRVGVWHTIQGRSLLNPSVRTLAERFAEAGYLTGIFGKWHLGDAYPLRAQDRGFQTTLVHGGGGIGQTPDTWGNDYFDPVLLEDGHPVKTEGYCTDVFFDAAIRFIEAADHEPYFCYLPTNAPHSPYRIDSRAAAELKERGVPSPAAEFYAMIENIDGNIGRLLEMLDRTGRRERTLIVFLTDNGTAEGWRSPAGPEGWQGFNAGMRGTKGSPYEGGHRVPCFLSYPEGGFVVGETKATTAHFDLAPTLLESAGIEFDASDFDGRSLLAVVRGEATLADRRIVVHSQRRERPEKWHQTVVIDGVWRLVRGRELYHLESDPGQTRDVASEFPDRVADLRGFYERWWDEVSVDFDASVRMVIGSDSMPRTTLTAHDWHEPTESVPWHQSMIKKDQAGSGTWALQVVNSGRYVIELRMRPESVAYRFGQGDLRVEIGDRVWEQALVAGADVQRVELELAEGEVDLRTWIHESGHEARGAYFIALERL